MYTITTPGRIGQFTNNIYSHQVDNIINNFIEQAMEVRSTATEEYETRIVFRLPYIDQMNSVFGHRIKRQVLRCSIPKGGDYPIFHNSILVWETRKRKLTDDNDKFSNITIHVPVRPRMSARQLNNWPNVLSNIFMNGFQTTD